jgi:hypothetical protein
VVLGWLSLVFTAVTVLLLIGDLHQPRRFLYLLTMPNTRSWLVRGGWVLTAHGVLSAAYAFGLGIAPLAFLAGPVALMTSIYTAFLFRQARGRELWCEDKWLLPTLATQAGAAAAAFGWLWGELDGAIWIVAYLVVMAISAVAKPATEQAARAHAVMMRMRVYKLGFLFTLLALWCPPLVVAAFACFDHAYVKAGQEVPLS